MFGFITQMAEFINFHHLHPFVIFFLLTWGVFGLRIALALRNKQIIDLPEYDKTAHTTSAIVFTFHDDPDLLKESLISIKAQQTPFTEVIVACDPDETEDRKAIIAASGFIISEDANGNKRDSFATALAIAKGDIVVHLAGDTIYPADMNTQAMVAFASDAKIGAVAFRQTIFDHKRNLIRRFANIMYGLRFRITYPALSSQKSLLCVTGETGYFLRAPIEKHMDEFLNDRFMGRRCLIGDDRFLTSMVLKEGYSVIVQNSAQGVVLTDCPNTFSGFVRQQLRWYRSNQRYSIKTIFGWIPGRPFLKTHLIAFMVLPYFWLGLIVWWLVSVQFSLYPIQTLANIPGTVILTAAIVGFFAAFLVKTAPHFWKHKEDYLVFIPYVIFSTFVILPVFVYALLTVGNQGAWGTKRGGGPSSKIRSGATLGLLSLALVIAIPLLLIEVIAPHETLAAGLD